MNPNEREYILDRIMVIVAIVIVAVLAALLISHCGGSEFESASGSLEAPPTPGAEKGSEAGSSSDFAIDAASEQAKGPTLPLEAGDGQVDNSDAASIPTICYPCENHTGCLVNARWEPTPCVATGCLSDVVCAHF